MNPFEIQMNWNLMEFLPEQGGIRKYFSDIVAGYIYSVYLKLTETTDDGANHGTPKRRKTTLSQLTQRAHTGVGSREDISEFAKNLISNELQDKLFLVTERIFRKYPSMKVTEDAFNSPFLNISSKNTLNPALEFVKSICKVLALDKDIEEEIMKLRTNLLRLIGMGEFSPSASWKDPSLSWVLPEVICKGCNHCRDIDLCKDTHRTNIDGVFLWQCPVCQTNYDNATIEYMLIDALNRKTMGYVLQDIQCKKCLAVKMDNVQRSCKCTGLYQTLITPNDINAHIRTFDIVAKYFKMPLLGQMIEWIIEQNKFQ